MSGYNHFAGLAGSKVITLGKEADKFNFTSVDDAFGALHPGGVLMIYPGTYSATSELSLAFSCSVIGIGDVTINGGTAGIEDRLLMVNKPAAGTADDLITVSNIKFVNAYAAADAVEIDNDGGATGTLTTVWNQCGFSTNAGLSVDLDANDTLKCYHYFYGARHLPFDDDMNIDLEVADSEVHVSGYQLDGGETFILGTTNTAWVVFLDNIIYSSEALTSGGNASVIENFTNCAKIASGAIAAPVIEDMDATAASENVQVGTLDT